MTARNLSSLLDFLRRGKLASRPLDRSAGVKDASVQSVKSASVSPEVAKNLRDQVHNILRPTAVETVQPLDMLFAEFVKENRSRGINPALGDDEHVIVNYPHRDVVPMRGDLYWGQGRTISRSEINRRFLKSGK